MKDTRRRTEADLKNEVKEVRRKVLGEGVVGLRIIEKAPERGGECHFQTRERGARAKKRQFASLGEPTWRRLRAVVDASLRMPGVESRDVPSWGWGRAIVGCHAYRLPGPAMEDGMDGMDLWPLGSGHWAARSTAKASLTHVAMSRCVGEEGADGQHIKGIYGTALHCTVCTEYSTAPGLMAS